MLYRQKNGSNCILANSHYPKENMQCIYNFIHSLLKCLLERRELPFELMSMRILASTINCIYLIIWRLFHWLTSGSGHFKPCFSSKQSAYTVWKLFLHSCFLQSSEGNPSWDFIAGVGPCLRLNKTLISSAPKRCPQRMGPLEILLLQLWFFFTSSELAQTSVPFPS